MRVIHLARKPLAAATVTANITEFGCGALHVDACRIPTSDKLGGGRLAGPTDMRNTCGGPEWDRPWMHDRSKRSVYAAETARKVALAERLGRWPSNVILDELVAQEEGDLSRYFKILRGR